MTTPDPKRQKRVSPSNPRLIAEGMHDLDPTQLIDTARQKLREATREITAPLAPKTA